MEQGLNANLYWQNDDLAHTVSLVPTSAHTGEGIPDLLRMLITLTQERLTVRVHQPSLAHRRRLRNRSNLWMCCSVPCWR
jgi:translation initiation factor IF-2